MLPYAKGKIPFQSISWQENNPKFTAKITGKWFLNNIIMGLDWALQSPDVNPIKNLLRVIETSITGKCSRNCDTFLGILNPIRDSAKSLYVWQRYPSYREHNLLETLQGNSLVYQRDCVEQSSFFLRNWTLIGHNVKRECCNRATFYSSTSRKWPIKLQCKIPHNWILKQQKNTHIPWLTVTIQDQISRLEILRFYTKLIGYACNSNPLIAKTYKLQPSAAPSFFQFSFMINPIIFKIVKPQLSKICRQKSWAK